MFLASDIKDIDMLYNKKMNIFVVAVLILLCYLIFIESGGEYVADAVWESDKGTETGGALSRVPFNIDKLSESVVREQQIEAFNAVFLHLGGADIESPVSSRPKFISPLEWEILRRVSGNEENPEKSLANYINHVRFAKQEELWEQLIDTEDAGKRHAVAEQLLVNIPSRVKNNNISVQQAQRLQVTLLRDLIDDPDQRRSRISEEADKIGVTFRIEKFVSALGG